MNAMHQLRKQTWVNYLTLGVFLLWSGMFICMLPSPAGHTGIQSAAVSTSSMHAWHSDCVGGGAQTFCKSEARTGLLGSFHVFAGIDGGSIDRLIFDVVKAPLTVAPILPVETRFLSIFLVFCSFLK